MTFFEVCVSGLSQAESWALFAGMMHVGAMGIYGFAALMVSL